MVAITTQDKGIREHIRIEPTEGGQTKTGFIMPETIRHVSKERFIKKHDRVTFNTMRLVENSLRELLWL